MGVKIDKYTWRFGILVAGMIVFAVAFVYGQLIMPLSLYGGQLINGLIAYIRHYALFFATSGVACATFKSVMHDLSMQMPFNCNRSFAKINMQWCGHHEPMMTLLIAPCITACFVRVLQIMSGSQFICLFHAIFIMPSIHVLLCPLPSPQSIRGIGKLQNEVSRLLERNHEWRATELRLCFVFALESERLSCLCAVLFN